MPQLVLTLLRDGSVCLSHLNLSGSTFPQTTHRPALIDNGLQVYKGTLFRFRVSIRVQGSGVLDKHIRVERNWQILEEKKLLSRTLCLPEVLEPFLYGYLRSDQNILEALWTSPRLCSLHSVRFYPVLCPFRKC